MTSAIASAGIRTQPRPRCPLCEGPGDWIHRGLVDRLFAAPGEWGYRRCGSPDCGLVWIDPLPIEEDLAKAYRDYYTHHRAEPARAGRGVWAAAELLWRLTGVDRVRQHLEHLLLDDRAPGRLLEIGCGTGERLARLRGAGWEVEGQEIDATAADVARRRLGVAAIHHGPLEALGLPAASYDAIASSHVLEHVRDPAALLGECRRLLRPAGSFVAITPNAASLGHARYGRDWFYLDPPRHLQIFTPRALATAAARAGFAATVQTSSARAQTVAASSLELRRPSFVRGRFARSVRDLAAVSFQIEGQARLLFDAASGEECLLTASPRAAKDLEREQRLVK